MDFMFLPLEHKIHIWYHLCILTQDKIILGENIVASTEAMTLDWN